MSATMTESPQHPPTAGAAPTDATPQGPAAPGAAPQLRVTRHGYAPEDVHGLLATARRRLVALSERLQRAEAANVTLVEEARRWRARAEAAEGDCRRLVEALEVAEATVAGSVAEVQVRADHLMVRARCEADHLRARAQEEADRVREQLEVERMAQQADEWLGEGYHELDPADADPDLDPVFRRFMSDAVEDEPSREWVLGEG